MKHIIFATALLLLIFGACTKDNTKITSAPVAASTAWGASYAAPASGLARAGERRTDLRIAIRKETNTTNKYRLVLKVDSVNMTVGEKEYMVKLPGEATVIAGLSMEDPKNPDKKLVIFQKGQLSFFKENENGISVFVSEPFVSDAPLTYELVTVTLKVETSFAVLLGKPLNETYVEEHMVMENGKTIQQDPTIERYHFNVKENGKFSGNVTISGDIAKGVPYLKIEMEAIDIRSLSAPQYPTLTMEQTHFNKETGVARYRLRNGRWDGEYSDGKQPGYVTIYMVSNNGDRYLDKAVKVNLWETN